MANRFTDSWHGKLDAVVVELHANPVFHMGLASKELFHSNFLGWLLQTSRENAELVLGQWLEADSNQVHPFSVEQEQQHFDLVARIPGFAPIVFENKLFQTLSPKQNCGGSRSTKGRSGSWGYRSLSKSTDKVRQVRGTLRGTLCVTPMQYR